MNKSTQLLLTLAAGLTVTTFSCNPDDVVNTDTTDPAVKSTYVLAIRAEGTTESTDYIVVKDTLDKGVITTVGNGIEQKSFRSYNTAANKLFSLTYLTDNTVPAYQLNAAKQLEEQGKFSIGQLHMHVAVDDTTILGMNIPRNGSKLATFYRINARQLAISSRATTDVFALVNNGEQAYFSGLQLNNGKLYAPFFQIANASFVSSHTDSAYVAIYSYPGLVLEKVIRDNRTGPIGVYFGRSGMFRTENGDMYSLSTTAISSGYSQMTRPSGILRIKSGASEFDPAYFFNIESATGGYKAHSFTYVGNGKALAQIYSFKNHVAADKWTYRDLRLAVIDLAAQTVTYVDGVPLHKGGYNLTNIQDNGRVYVKIQNATDGVYIYSIDVATAKGTKGAKIQGADLIDMFKLTL